MDNSNIIRVECRLEFVKIGSIDTREQCFSASIKIRTKWYDTEVLTKYNADLNWNPKIYVENAKNDVNYLEENSYKTTFNEGKTEIMEIKKIKGKKYEFFIYILYLILEKFKVVFGKE